MAEVTPVQAQGASVPRVGAPPLTRAKGRALGSAEPYILSSSGRPQPTLP